MSTAVDDADTQDKKPAAQGRSGTRTALITIAVVMAIMVGHCYMGHASSNSIRAKHAAAGQKEIIAGNAGHILNPLSWFWSWPTAVWFYEPKEIHRGDATIVFAVWTIDAGTERRVKARRGANGVESCSVDDPGDHWRPLPPGHLATAVAELFVRTQNE